MIDEDAPQIRRLSLYRQLSDVLKSKRRSLCTSTKDSIPPPATTTHSPLSKFTFLWSCKLAEIDLSSNEHSNHPKSRTESIDEIHCLIKQKSISYDDIAFISSNGNKIPRCTNKINDKSKTNGLLNFSFC